MSLPGRPCEKEAERDSYSRWKLPGENGGGSDACRANDSRVSSTRRTN